MNDINIGIVGLGWVAGAHISAFNKISGAKVTAVCSRRKQNEKELERQYGTSSRSITITTRCLPILRSTS